ncbi:high nitrogen upregulated cytochrome P450 monooxygenase 2 [Imleria badia]|nr:high nitrogen upregulated cytochrome P450 monooxygenase 2 [Imleria badia]
MNPADTACGSLSAVHRRFNQHEPSCSWSLLLVLTVPSLPTWVLINHAFSFPMAFLAAYALFFATLFTSIVVYRLSSFHPLAKYPGPSICKISQLWAVIVNSRGKAHHYRKLLHDQYGPIVRIGPNELSVTDKDMLPYILGSQGMPKGPIFEGRKMTPMSDKDMEQLNLISTRDLQRHAVLRKAWNKAFSDAPLRDYEELMLLRAHQLINTLKNICKEQGGVGCVDIASWIGYFTLLKSFLTATHDHLSFGGGFELMRDGDTERLLPNMSKSLYFATLSQAVPWFACVLRNLPYVGEPMRVFGSFGFQRAKIRYDQEPDRKDLFYHLVNVSDVCYKSPFPLIVSNAILAIIAGADTTATVLRNTIFYLLTNPTYYARLREEVDATFPPTETSPLDLKILPSLTFLNAVINEVLRLQPPVPTTLQRAPARGTRGKLIGTHYIKEGTQIQVPPYVLHRDPRYFFPRPDEFWPERWILETLDSQEFVLDRSAFIPFSMGPANCAGKSLAMLELRAVVSLFIMHFDIEFDDGFDPKTWVDSLKDHFVLESGKLMVKLRARRRASFE